MTMDDALITGQDLGRALCEALDLDPNGVTSVTITAAVGRAPTVTVATTVVTGRHRDALAKTLRAYRLVPAQLHPDQLAGE